MLIPDNIHPEQTIYYNASFVLKILQEFFTLDFIELYVKTKSEKHMSMPVFILCLDWLFMLGLIKLNDNKVEICS
jgi:hypothetical protein